MQLNILVQHGSCWFCKVIVRAKGRQLFTASTFRKCKCCARKGGKHFVDICQVVSCMTHVMLNEIPIYRSVGRTSRIRAKSACLPTTSLLLDSFSGLVLEEAQLRPGFEMSQHGSDIELKDIVIKDKSLGKHGLRRRPKGSVEELSGLATGPSSTMSEFSNTNASQHRKEVMSSTQDRLVAMLTSTLLLMERGEGQLPRQPVQDGQH